MARVDSTSVIKQGFFVASGHFCHLLIAFAKSLDTPMVFLKEFVETVNFLKSQLT